MTANFFMRPLGAAKWKVSGGWASLAERREERGPSSPAQITHSVGSCGVSAWSTSPISTPRSVNLILPTASASNVIAHPAERWDGGFQIGVSEGLIFD